MFDLVRKHTKILMFMMFLLIIPAFVTSSLPMLRQGMTSSSCI